MKKTLISMVLILALGFSACTNTKEDKANMLSNTEEISNHQKAKNMKNLISIVEIPTSDFSRAVTFYQTILDVVIEEVDIDGMQMGVLPSDGETVNVVLVKGIDYTPTADGAVIYLNAGNDLQPILDKVEKNGGKIIVPKTEISSEMGFFALLIDTEGNKLGLHSSN